MSTGYALSLGYMSGYSTKMGDERAWDELVKCVQTLRYQPERLVAEVKRVEPNTPETCKNGCCTLLDAATWYQLEEVGPLVFNTAEKYIMQLTTSGGNNRELKEPVRRAFCRLVIEEMHKQGVEVCLEVC